MDSPTHDLKQPLTARCDSTDGSDGSDRNSPSPISMLASTLQNGQAYHHYANPQELKAEVVIELDRLDARKKKNLIYEPISPSETPSKANGYNLPPRNSHVNDDISYKENHNKRLYKILLLIVFIFALCALVLSLLSVLGILNIDTKEKEPSSAAQTGVQIPELIHGSMIDSETVHQLQHNVTHLTNNVIPLLKDEIASLQKKLEEKSKDGKPGAPGPIGPPGAGDFSKCEHKIQETKTSISVTNPEDSMTTSDYITEKADTFVMGVTCSTKGAAEYGLFQKRSASGKRQFYCKCAGKARTPAFQTIDNYMYCSIHYWQCPKTTS